MEPERRCAHRELPEKLSYIQFEPAGGGIVVDASERGLGFHVAGARHQVGPVQLCISPNPMQQIRLRAEIAWMDRAKKSGGLRFTDLTEDGRNQLRQWLTSTRIWETPGRKLVSSNPRAEEGARWLQAEDQTLDLLPPAVDNAMSTRTDAAATKSIARSCSIPFAALAPAPFSQEKRVVIFQPRLQRGLTTGFLILILVILPTLFLHSFRREIGNTLVGIGESLKGNSEIQPDAASSIPMQIPNADSGRAPSAPNPFPKTSAKEISDQSDPLASTEITQGSASSTDARFEDHQYSGNQLGDSDSRRGRTALARQLWSALEAGDSSAEVKLAQLYLTGDGVPRNCEQARILLRAASKKGSMEALQELRKLNSSPCR